MDRSSAAKAKQASEPSARPLEKRARTWARDLRGDLAHLLSLRSVASRWEQKRWCSWALASVGFRPFFTATLLLLYWAAIEAPVPSADFVVFTGNRAGYAVILPVSGFPYNNRKLDIPSVASVRIST